MIKPLHIRMARAGLDWSLADLAQRAGVNPNTLSRYEAGRDVLSSTVAKAEHALRAAGVMFIDEDDWVGVRLSRNDATARSSSRALRPK